MKRALRLAVLLLSTALLLTGCGGLKYGGSNDDRIVMQVGEYKVTADEYLYFYRNAKRDFDHGLDSYWTDNPGAAEKLKTTVEDMLRQRYAVDALAKECSVSLTKDDEKELKEDVAYTVQFYGGEEAYYAALADANLTGDLYWALERQSMLDTRLRDVYIAEYSGYIRADDAALLADLPVNFIRVKNILIKNETNDDILANLALAEELAKRAKAGENFDELIAAYGEDNAQDKVNGRYFTHGMLLDEFEEAAWSLGIGEISGVVQTTVGYHIIQRLPLEDAYIDENFEELRDYYKNRLYNEKLAETAASLPISYTEDYAGLEGLLG